MPKTRPNRNVDEFASAWVFQLNFCWNLPTISQLTPQGECQSAGFLVPFGLFN